MQLVTAAETVAGIRSGKQPFVCGGTATPSTLPDVNNEDFRNFGRGEGQFAAHFGTDGTAT